MKKLIFKQLLTIVLPWLFNQLSSVKIFKKRSRMKKEDVVVNAIVKVARFGNELGDALEDGKIRIDEAVGFLDNIIGFWGVVADWPEIKLLWPQYQNDPVKRGELIAKVKEELDLPNDKIEKIIEEGLDVIEQLYELLMAIRD